MSRFQSRQNILRPVQNINIINPTNEILTENQEGNTLIWYDTSSSLTNENIVTIKRLLRSVNDYVLLFDDEEKCVQYIKSVNTDNIFIVISGANSTSLLRQIHDIEQVKGICIFCMNTEVHKSLLNDYDKIIGIYNEQEELITYLNETICSFLQKTTQISLMKNNTKQETHLNAFNAYHFKKQQLIKDIILRMPQTEQSKQKLVDYCRCYYQGNEKVLKDVDEFDKFYDSPSQAIILYTRDSLWYRIINRAFRIQDPELLERFQFFISDLSQSLKCGFEQLKTSLTLSEQKTLTLYRGHQFSKDEYSRFPSYGFVTFNSYLSASLDIEVAKVFAGFGDNQNLSDTDLVPVLFVIELDLTSLNNNTVILANISKSSHFTEECEYLFDFSATFEIIDDDNRIIKMIPSDKPHHVSSTQLYNAYLYKYASKDIINQIGDNSSQDNFTSSLLYIDKSLLRLDAFEDYILKTSIHDENYQTASNYCINGHILPRIDPDSFYAREYRKINPDNPYIDEYTNAFNQAIKYFQAFYDYASDDLIQWALQALGYTHYKIDKYLEAQTYFNQALKINNDSLNLITCYYFLGCTYGKSSDYEESTNYFNKILQIKDSIEPSFIAATYCQMAMLQLQNIDNQEEYLLKKTMKKEYLSYALDIYQQTNEELFILKCHSELLNLEDWASKDDCVGILDQYYKYCQDQQIALKLIIELYETIGYRYFEDFEYDQALKCYMKTVLYFPDNVPSHHIISEIYVRKKDSKSAIEYLKKTLKLTKDSKKVVNCYFSMGLEHFKQNNFSKALACLEKSVLACNESDCDTQFSDYILDFEIQRKSEIATCKSMINSNCSTTKKLYFCFEALIFSLDLIKLFQAEIIFFSESIDFIRKTNYTEQVRLMIEKNSYNTENYFEKFIFEMVFDNYIIMGDDTNALFYYTKALKIYHEGKRFGIHRDIDSMCTSKINYILNSNYSYNDLIDHIHGLFKLSNSQDEMQVDQDLYKRNYLIELKQNQLGKLYSHIGDIYLKIEKYEEAKLNYDKSIEYYETFPLLFHLQIADLYSKKGLTTHAQHKQQAFCNDNNTLYIKAQELFEKSISIIKNGESV